MDKEKFDATIVMGGKRGPNWFKSTSPYGYNIAECISAAVKEIRRSNEEMAIFWAHQVAISGQAAEKFIWEILRVHCIEDIGLANPQAINVVTDVMRLYFDLPNIDEEICCACPCCYLYGQVQENQIFKRDAFRDASGIEERQAEAENSGLCP